MNRHDIALRIWDILEGLRLKAIARGMDDEDARLWAIGVCERERAYTSRARKAQRYASARCRAMKNIERFLRNMEAA